MNTPSSPIGQYPMELLMTIPLDWRRPKVRQSYNIFWCDKSQYGMLYPRPHSEEIAASYDVADYYTHDKTIATSSHSKRKPSFFDWLIFRISWQLDDSIYIENDWFTNNFGAEPGRVLDIGCGSGKILARFRAQGYTTLGVEPDEVARDIARGRGLNVIDGTAENLPPELEGQQFDAVVMTHTLEHTLDPVEAIKNAAALLAPGGKLIVETPNNQALGFKEAGPAWRWLDVPRHLNFFTPTSLRAMCHMAGLTPETTEFRGYSRQFNNDWISDEQRIWDRYNASRNMSTMLPKRNTTWQAWKLFLKTLVLEEDEKYDSVRVIAVKPK